MYHYVHILKAVRRIITVPIGSSSKPSITVCCVRSNYLGI